MGAGVASHGWTNWEIKKEPLTKFANPPTRRPTTVLELDTPRQRNGLGQKHPYLPCLPCLPVVNPGSTELGLPEDEEHEAMDLDEMDGGRSF